MTSSSLQFSIEELAFAMGLLGGADMANGFLRSLLGDRGHDEIGGRLFAAAHALMARGFLEVCGDEKILDPAFQSAVSLMIRNDLSLRCNRLAESGEQVRTVHVRGQLVLEQSLRNPVVAQLEYLDGFEEAFARYLVWYGLDEFHDGEYGEPLGSVPLTVFESLLSNPPVLLAPLEKELTGTDIPRSVIADLTADVVECDVRGSVLRVVREGDRIEAGCGFLVVRRGARCWLLDLSPDQTSAVVYPGSRNGFRRLFKLLWAVATESSTGMTEPQFGDALE